MKCFYHNDNDGKASAVCVSIYADNPDSSEQFIPMDYTKKFPLDTIQEGETVWIVDYSIKPEEMEALLQITPNVTWIDHHKTAIERYADFLETNPVRGIRLDGEAGCSLTWKYLTWWTTRGIGDVNFNVSSIRQNMFRLPRFIALIADRDIWVWEYGKTTAEFHAGLSLYDTEPTSDVWDLLLDSEQTPINEVSFLDKVCDQGKILLGANKLRYAALRQSFGWESEFEGYRTALLNVEAGSEAFGGDLGELPEDYDMFVTYTHNGEDFVVSLYSAKIDVSSIAKRYGGGGHKGAAGFQCRSLPFIPV